MNNQEKPKKPMRDAMPNVAAFVDALKLQFGTEYIEQMMVRGLRAGTFYAEENGHTVGQRLVENPDRIVAGEHVIIEKPKELTMGTKTKR
jgi:hypothetical protein